jgi:hypothetical protein
LKLLVLLQGRAVEDQIGYHRGFEALLAAGMLSRYQSIPYRRTKRDGSSDMDGVYDEALAAMRTCGTDCLLLQWFHGDLGDPRPFIRAARAINPALVVVTTGGDPFGRWLNPMPASFWQASSASDLTFLTSMGYMAQGLERRGSRNIALMPHGVCQERFVKPFDAAPVSKEFDVVFIGSNNGGRNPFSTVSRGARRRRAMVSALQKRYGKRFALFGRHWQGHPSWQGPVPFAEQVNTARRARVQVGGFPSSGATYYASDRPYIAMASGVPFLDFMVDRLGSLAEPHRHFFPYAGLAGLIARTDELLDKPQATLDAIGAETREMIVGGHTHYHRAREMLDIARRLAEHRARGEVMAPPLLQCFHPGIDPRAELPWAVGHWLG